MDRLPYSIADLNKIFASPVYRDAKRWTAGGGEAAFWIPLIGLFTGARLEEIGQLLIEDIRTENDIIYFDFIEFDDEAESVGIDVEEKSVKTHNARRKVPVHPILIEHGLPRYVANLKTDGFRHLFPALKEYRGRRTHNWSKWWARYTDQFVTKSARKVFHSFRHLFADRLRNIFGREEIIKPLMGHAAHMYGQVISLEKRYEIICKLDFPGLDLTYVRAAADGLFQDKIKTLS